MENAVIAGRHIETNGPLGAIDALRQAGHSALKRLERPCRIVAVAPCLEPAFRTVLMMIMRSRPAVAHLTHRRAPALVEDQLQRHVPVDGFPYSGSGGEPLASP